MPIKHLAEITKEIPTTFDSVFTTQRFLPMHWSSNDCETNYCSTQANYQLTIPLIVCVICS